MQFRAHIFACLLPLFVLAGCGGGGDGASSSPVNSITQERLATPVNGASNYLLYLPEGYATNATKKWPVIIYLHGSQPLPGLTLGRLRYEGVMGYMLSYNKGLPAIVVQPQQDINWHLDPGGIVWHDPVFVDAVIRDVEQRYAVDTTRISITGGSMGGYGSWSMALAYPRRFAAVMPVAGAITNDHFAYFSKQPLATSADLAGSFSRPAGTPFRVYAGTVDQNVPIAEMRNVVQIFRAGGGNPDVREADTDHYGIQNAAFTAEPFAWMLAQVRVDASEETTPINAADYTGTYRESGGVIVTATLVGDKLVLTYSDKRNPLSYIPVGNDHFLAEWVMHAKRDALGRVKCLSTPPQLQPDLVRDGATESCN